MSTRKPIISFLRSDISGCSHYRLIQIKDKLLERGLIRCLDNDTGYSPLSDIYIWQRYDDIELLDYLDNQINVYEIDDNYWELPEYLGPTVDYYKDNIKSLEDFMRACDYVTTTTDKLAEEIHKRTGIDLDKIIVIPNFIDFDKLRFSAKNIDKVNIAWSLDPRRKDTDIEPVKGALLRLLDEFDNVNVLFFGDCPESFEGLDRVKLIKGTDVETYYENLARVKIDIGICPAVDSVFNNCKSSIKLLEFASIGSAVVCSDIYPYRLENLEGIEYFRDHYSHIVCNNEEDWYFALRTLIEDQELREKTGIDLHNYVKSYYNLDNGIYRYLDFWESLIDCPDEAEFSRKYSDKKFLYSVCTRDKSKLSSINDLISRNSKYYNIEILVAENDGSKSLGDFYNYVIDNCKDYDYYIFAHDDLEIPDEGLFRKIIEGLEVYDVLGVAGNTLYNPMEGSWCGFRTSALTAGSVAHRTSEGVKYFNYGPSKEVLVVDGLFIVTTREVLDKVRFKAFGNFHFYDIDFCLKCNKEGFKIGVIPIDIIHDSPGSYDKMWFKALEEFRGDYGISCMRLDSDDLLSSFEVVIDENLKGSFGCSFMIDSLEKQSVKIFYRFGKKSDGDFLFIDRNLLFFPHSFKLLYNVYKLGKYSGVNFQIGSRVYQCTFNDLEMPIYPIKVFLGLDYDQEYILKIF